MEERPTSPGISRRRSHSSWLPILSLRALLTTFASLSVLGVLLAAYSTSAIPDPTPLPPNAWGGTAGACRMTYSSPTYLHLSGFGREFARRAESTWALYLYREAGWDPDPLAHGRVDDNDPHPDRSLRLTGTPVLFIPGNAGSYKQVRSFASIATRTYHSLPGVKRKMPASASNPGSRQLDVFTLDFNEDFSAFHGQTLLDQAEYVADAIRYILSLYRPEPPLPDPTSVIVLAHSMGGVVARAAMLHSHFQKDSISTLITFATPHNVPPASVDRAVDAIYTSLARPTDALPPITVSIAAGQSDIQIASESSALILDPTDGFTVFTSAIPNLRSSMDHLAVLWCEQLMQVIARSLLSLVDIRVPSGVVDRSDRLRRLEKELLGGWESSAARESLGSGRSGVWSKGDVQHLGVGKRLTHHNRPWEWKEGQEAIVYVMPIPEARTYGSAKSFTLVSERSIGRRPEEGEVYACSSPTEEREEECVPLFPSHSAFLPRIVHEAESMGVVDIDADALLAEDKDSVVVVVKRQAGWVIAEIDDREKRTLVVEHSALQLLLSGYRLEGFPSTPKLVSELALPALDTSLLTLKLDVAWSPCQDTAIFPPTMRQHSSLAHESKFFPSVRSATLHTHVSGPYEHQRPHDGTKLQFFVDPTCGGGDLRIDVTVDIWKTLGNLIVRYRMSVVAFPFATLLLVLAVQLREYNAGRQFVSFASAISLSTKRVIAPLLVALSIASIIQAIIITARPGLGDSTWVADALMGNRGAFWSFLAPLIAFTAFGIMVLEVCVVQLVVGGIAELYKLEPIRTRFPISETRESLPVQRVLSMGFLLVLVLFFAPYQFAFLVIFLVHLFSTIRSLVLAQEAPSATEKHAWNRYHYSFSVLLLMMSLLPLSALILVVWVRSLAVGWLAPFSSDHNVLNIVGYLVNVEALHSGKMLQRSDGSLSSFFSVAVPSAFAAYSFLYGIRYTHTIFPLANALALYLAANSSDALVGRAYHAVVGRRRQITPPADPPPGAPPRKTATLASD